MKRKYTHYATALVLGASLALSPVVANAKNITYCGATIAVSWWVAPVCKTTIAATIATCSAPVDGGVACASSVTAASLLCGSGVYTIIKACFD